MKTPPEDEPEEEEDNENTSFPPANAVERNGEVVMSTDTFLDLLYLATRSNSQSLGNDNRDSAINWNDGDGSYDSVNCSDDCETDCDCDDCDQSSDGDYDEDDCDVEVILEEIRRISEALLGSTMSELVDSERRMSLKTFDELAARDESVSSIMDEWEYDDSEVCDRDGYCQGVAERIQLFLRAPQRDVAERPLQQGEGAPLVRRPAVSRPPPAASDLFVVFFEPSKVGVLPKPRSKENQKTPKLKHSRALKKAPQRVRLDKDSVRRWSEDDEKEDLTRVFYGVGAVAPGTSLREALSFPTPVPRHEPRSVEDVGHGPFPRSALSLPRQPSPLTTSSTVGTPPDSPSFVVSLPVGNAAPSEVHVALYTNRVLVAEVVRRVHGAAGERCECTLVRRWSVPEDVNVDTFRCFLGDGLLLVAAHPLPEGFLWPFESAPELLGAPLRVAWSCDFVP